MKVLKIALTLVLLILMTCNQKESTIKMPTVEISSSAIQIDGIFNEKEWDAAFSVAISDSVMLLVFQNDMDIFIGIESKSALMKTSTDLFLSNTSIGQINLHSSQKLGERIYEQQTWNPKVNEWNWGNNTQWTSNVITWDETKRANKSLPMIFKYIYFDGQEFVISKEKIKEETLNLRVKVVVVKSDDTWSTVEYPTGEAASDNSTWLNFSL